MTNAWMDEDSWGFLNTLITVGQRDGRNKDAELIKLTMDSLWPPFLKLNALGTLGLCEIYFAIYELWLSLQWDFKGRLYVRPSKIVYCAAVCALQSVCC